MKHAFAQLLVRATWLLVVMGGLWWARLHLPIPDNRWGPWCATTVTQVWVVTAGIALLACLFSADRWRVRLWAAAAAAVLCAGLLLGACRLPGVIDNPPPASGVGTPWLLVVVAVGGLTAALSHR